MHLHDTLNRVKRRPGSLTGVPQNMKEKHEQSKY